MIANHFLAVCAGAKPLRIDSRTVLNLYGLNSTIISGINGDDVKGKLFMGALQMNIARASGTVQPCNGASPSGMDV